MCVGGGGRGRGGSCHSQIADRGLGRGETFFPDSGSDRDSDETFQISRNLGLVHVEFICLLDSQPWPYDVQQRLLAVYYNLA